MSTSRAPSLGRSQSLSHPPGTPSSTEWVCQACQAERNVISELVMTDGHMVCPKCALVDAVATSAKSHVDLSADQSQIFDPLQSLQTLDAGWAQRDESLDRVFMAHADTMMTTFLSKIVKNTSHSLRNGTRLWFRDIREADRIDEGTKNLRNHIKSTRITVMMAMAVRMACQESNLISLYNRLKNKEVESKNAIKQYAKGDDTVPVMSYLEFFHVNQELPLTDPARLKTYELFREIETRFHKIMDYQISPCDYTLSLVLRVSRELLRFVNATPAERKSLIKSKDGQKTKKGWPDEPFDALKKVGNWDDVIRMAHDLWQATNCVSLYPDNTPAGQSSAAIVLTILAAETVMGDCLPSNTDYVHCEMAQCFDIGISSVRKRRTEIEKFIPCWATSLPEVGLPIPPLKRSSKRSSQTGEGTGGWGSDKRRGIPPKVILPIAARAVAAHWKDLKQARLRRPGLIPFDKEEKLCKRMFAGNDISQELADLLVEHCDSTSSIRDSSSERELDSRTGTPSESPRARLSSVQSEEITTPRMEEQVDEIDSQPINKPDMVQAWIENGDASSGDEGDSSDDDTPRAAKRMRREPPDSRIGELPQPFAFSIGNKGFQVEKVLDSTRPTESRPSNVVASAASTTSQISSSASGDGIAHVSEAHRMERQNSNASSSRSTASTLVNAASTASGSRRPAPLLAKETPAPLKITRGEHISERAERESIQRGLNNPNDHSGVLVRERKVYCLLGHKRPTVRDQAGKKLDSVVVRSINNWLDKQRNDGMHMPDADGRAYMQQAIADAEGRIDVRDRIDTLAHQQSPLETLLRLGVPPSDLPHNVVPHSACGVNLDLFHFAQRKAILGEGDVEETDELRDMSLRLFFRGPCNDSLEDTFLDEVGVAQRTQAYHYKGFWDVLDDNSPLPKPKFRKRKPEIEADPKPENMIQRIAHEAGRKDLKGEEETDMIQKAALAGLIFIKPLPIWDPFKVTASVPRNWFDDGLYELGLVTSSKLDAKQAWEVAESTWKRRKQQEQEMNTEASGSA